MALIAMSRSKLSQAQRNAYLVSRALGTANAARNGRLVQHIVKRHAHRAIIGGLRSLRLWP